MRLPSPPAAGRRESRESACRSLRQDADGVLGMSEFREGAFFGPYRLVRRLQSSRHAARWLGLHVRQQSSHVVHVFPLCADRSESRRFTQAFERLATLSHPHILKAEQFSFSATGLPVVVTPYTGNQDGLLTLGRLLDLKGGQLGVFEAERAARQLLETIAFGHEHGIPHGLLALDEVLVDRHGSLFIEHYGLRMASRAELRTPDLDLDEVRAVVSLAYQMMTGLEAGEPLIPPSRVVRRIDKAWDGWFAAGLTPTSGFESAAAAIEAMPSRAGAVPPSAVETPALRVRFPRFGGLGRGTRR